MICAPLSRGLRRGLGLTLLVLLLSSGCGKKESPPSVEPAKPTGGAAKTTGGTAPAPAGDAPLAGMIPTDVPAFGYVNVHKLWEGNEGKQLRKLAGGFEKPLQEMENEIGVPPAEIDHAAFIFTDLHEEPVYVIATIKPFDAAKLRKSIEWKGVEAPPIREEEYKGKKLIIQPLVSSSEVEQPFDAHPKNAVKDKGPAKDRGFSKAKGDRPPRPKGEDGPEPSRALVLLNDRTFAVGMDSRVRRWIDKTASGNSGPLVGAVARLAEGHCAVVGFNPGALPAEATRDAPASLQPLLKARAAIAVLDVGKESRLQVKLEFADEAAAKEGETATTAGIGLVSLVLPEGIKELNREVSRNPENLFVPPLISAAKELQTALSAVKPTRDGSTVQLALAVKLEVPEPSAEDVNKVKQGALRVRHQNNMKQIAIGFHNWAATYGDRLPPAAICDKDGKPILSWRVLLLPYIGEDILFREFKLDEAWDSPSNRKLLERMPKVYRLPGGDEKDTRTHYQALVGPDTLYRDYGKAAEAKLSIWPGIPKNMRGMLSAYSIANIPDGTSNTILVVEATEGVPWSKPEDLVYDAKKPLPKLGKMFPDRFLVGMADGFVRFVSKKVSEKTLRNAINPADGERLGKDWYSPE